MMNTRLYRKNLSDEYELYSNFYDWQNACNALNDLKNMQSPLTTEMLLNEINVFCIRENKGLLSNADNWVAKEQESRESSLPSQDFFNSTYDIFEPYIQKLEVPFDAEIAIHGDIHGDIKSLNAYIISLQEKGYMDQENPFKINLNKPNFYMIFLGDYTDRGNFGSEVIYTLLKLKDANPLRVFTIRGNHEDSMMNDKFGFREELEKKFTHPSKLLSKITRIYNYLPLAIYVVAGKAEKKSALIFCHGGLELGFTSGKLLLGAQGPIKFIKLGLIKRYDALQKLDEGLKSSVEKVIPHEHRTNFFPKRPIQQNTLTTIGFMWNDFNVKESDKIQFNQERGWKYSKELTTKVLLRDQTSNCKVRGVIRGHQHDDKEMINSILNHDNKLCIENTGISKLWVSHDKPGVLSDPVVCTFPVCSNVSPYKELFGLTYHTYGLLKVAEQYEHWFLEVHKLIVQV